MSATEAASTIRSPDASDVPAHDPLGVVVEPGARGDDVRADQPERRGPPLPHHHDGGGAVPEEAGGDEVRDRRVVALHGQGAELDGEQHGDAVGVTDQVVVHARHACRACHAAEPEHRDPFHVAAQPQGLHEPCVQGRRSDPGDRRGHEQVDVGGGEAGCVQRPSNGLCAQLDAHPDPRVVGVGEAIQRRVVLEGQRQVPGADAGVGMEALEDRPCTRVVADHVTTEDLGDRLLVVRMGPQSGSRPRR